MVRPIAVPGRLRPHEVLLLGWSLLFGVVGLWKAPAPGSLEHLVPHWQVLTWSAALAVSGAVGLVGCYWRRGSPMSAQLESGGLLIGAGAILFYCAAIIHIAGLSGLFPAGVIGSWMAANIWRAVQLWRDMKGN